MSKKIFSIVFILIISGNWVLAQKSNYDSLVVRVKNLEEYKANLDQLYSINEAKLEKTITDKIEEKTKEIEDSKKLLQWLLFLGLPVTVSGIIGLYIGSIKKARKLIEEKIETVIERKREELIKLIETQEFDSKLKRVKKIIILSPTDESNNSIKSIFDKFKFTNVKYRIVTDYQDFGDQDLIIFNDGHGNFTQDVITMYVDKTTDNDVNFVVFTNRNLVRNPRINFSNSSFTLYHNVLSTLKYGEILKITED